VKTRKKPVLQVSSEEKKVEMESERRKGESLIQKQRRENKKERILKK